MSLSSLFKLSGLSSRSALKQVSVKYLRQMLDEFAGFLNEDLPRVGAFHPKVPYKEIDGAQLTMDVTVPSGVGPYPVLVYLHGGAWIWGSPTTHQKLTHRLAEQGFLTLSVDYRLAPENPFPAGFNDCIHAIYFAAQFAEKWGGDPKRMVIAGDSAGANLAAATSIELANSVAAPVIHAVGLLYGVYDFRTEQKPDIMTELLNKAYLNGEQHLIVDPRVSPLLKSVSLPPAFVAIGSEDDLIDDAERLRAELLASDKVHEYHVYTGMPHAFAQMEFLPSARTCIRDMTNFLHKMAPKTSVAKTK